MSSQVSRYAYKAADPTTLPPADERFKRCRSVGEECQQEDELKKLLEVNPSPVAYDGFEPSGRMHIAQGVLKKINVDKLTSSGFTYIFWVADWFAFLNKKIEGDLEKIKTVGRYFITVWKALGMNMDRVLFLWASDEIHSRGDDYWGLVLDVSTKFSLTRVKRCSTIMGRTETDLFSSQIIYPCMQAADIFFMEVDVCQLGVDQRKVNMLAREYHQKSKGRKKPIILSHHMLLGLKQGQDKMSKSDPESAIFMEDSTKEITTKINKAYCPPGQAYEVQKIVVNPCLDYFKFVISVLKQVKIKVEGSEATYDNYDDLEKAFSTGKLKQEDLKESLAAYINQIVSPVREQLLALTKLTQTATKTVLYKNALSLKKGSEKSGKSDIDGTIFLEDSEEVIKKKVTSAFCPPKPSYEKKKTINPCMDYFKHLVFPSYPKVDFKREAKYGGDISFNKYEDFEASYIKNEIDPGDVKINLISYLDQLIQPVRDHFTNDPDAAKLLELVKQYRITK